MFTENFIKMLQRRNIKPYHVAKATGISSGAMAEYATGKKKPSIENLVKIADFLDVSTDELLGRDHKQPTASEGNSAPNNDVRSAIIEDEEKGMIVNDVKLTLDYLVTDNGIVKTVMYSDQMELARKLIEQLEPSELDEVNLFAEFIIAKRGAAKKRKEFVINNELVKL